ncbi:MAG: GMC family oxidoreductase [Deltaproteobacteria bacterium]|nr:GMC family oxidoreductase [Deltaproteobacteria bacterium]
MATRLKPVDVVTIGVGLTGTMAALEMTDAGLKVVGIERGAERYTVPDFQSPTIHDELRFSIRKAMMQDNVKEAVTFRNNSGQRALPLRRWESFLPGQGLGGSFVHWNGQSFRAQVVDFTYRTSMIKRYGKKFLEACGRELTIQDWGVTYDELEPYYDRFEYLLGVSGKAGNIKGKIQPGGNPLEAPRAREYPNPPLKEPYFGAIFRKGATDLGYHPYPQPSSNLSRPYVNPLGVKLEQCVFCGFCERYACEHYAKASPQTTMLPVLLQRPNYELRCNCEVLRINLDSTRKKATGVTYVDDAGREFEQPADIIFVTAYPLNNVRTLLLSGIGKPYDPRTGEGVTGRNYTYQTTGGPTAFMDESININPFMSSGAPGTMIDDFGGDNFDHSNLGFIGGEYVGSIMTNGRPIEFHPVPPGTPLWGLEWKKAVARYYNHTILIQQHGTSAASRLNYLDLDPTWKDFWGQPLLRMTFDFPENDIHMSQYIADKVVEICRAMGAQTIIRGGTKRPYSTQFYQSTHCAGGAVMGSDPRTSVVNRYLQCWDVANVFSLGASAFPQNITYNYSITIGALTFWALEHIRKTYLKSPGPLVQA